MRRIGPETLPPQPKDRTISGYITAVEAAYSGVHVMAIGLPYVASQVGGDRAMEAVRTSGERMAKAGMPDVMSIVAKEVEVVQAVTRMNTDSAIAGVFIFAALVTADAVRRFRQIVTRR